jgi:hypothetical protein
MNSSAARRSTVIGSSYGGLDDQVGFKAFDVGAEIVPLLELEFLPPRPLAGDCCHHLLIPGEVEDLAAKLLVDK